MRGRGRGGLIETTGSGGSAFSTESPLTAVDRSESEAMDWHPVNRAVLTRAIHLF